MSHPKTANKFYPIQGYQGYFINKLTTDVLCLTEDLPVILNQIPNSSGIDNYYIVFFGGKNHFVHRLMAKTFLAGPEKAHVNHKDGNKQNNSLSNLEWATPKENAQHAVATGLVDTTTSCKEVHQYSLKGEYIASFPSDIAAESATRTTKQNISKCTLGLREHAGGYQWRRVKLDKIAPVDAKVLKGAIIQNTKTDESITAALEGQNFFSPIVRYTGIKKHILVQRFRDSDVIFAGDYRIEKIYF